MNNFTCARTRSQRRRARGRSRMYKVNMEFAITQKMNEFISEIGRFDSDRAISQDEQIPITEVIYSKIAQPFVKRRGKRRVAVVADEGS